MNAEREGMQSARHGTSYGPRAKPDPVIDKATERRAAKSPMRRKRREIPTTVPPSAPPAHGYGAGF